jgi:hypothetical protein
VVGSWSKRATFVPAVVTYPLELMYVAVVLARVNVRRESRTPVVKSSVSVEPSPFAGRRRNLFFLRAIPVKALSREVVLGTVLVWLFVMGESLSSS